MNERIRELIEQADKLSLRFANENNVNHVDAFNIVFAELIVRMCADYAEHELDVAGYKKKFMLKHFGVEE